MPARRLTAILALLCLLPVGCTQVRTDEVLRIDRPVCPEDYTETVRVACIGDSYPAQLQRMLGDRWNVQNFGVSGATMLRQSNLPYWQRDTFRRAMAFRPHVVLIKLGTNDSKNHWNPDAFRRDYADMVDVFAALDTAPRIWLCLPVPAYEVKWEIRPEVIREEVLPIIRDIAKEKDLPLIDLYTALDDAEGLFPDKIHPNAEGAKRMAAAIDRALTGNGVLAD